MLLHSVCNALHMQIYHKFITESLSILTRPAKNTFIFYLLGLRSIVRSAC